MTTARAAAFATALAITVAGACAPALAARNTRYAGTTSEGMPVTFRVSPDGRRLVRLRIYFRAVCSDHSPDAQTYTNVFDSRIRHRRFASVGVYKGSLDGSTNDFRVNGTIRPALASGTFSWHATARRHGHKVHCSSGPVSWTAHPVD